MGRTARKRCRTRKIRLSNVASDDSTIFTKMEEWMLSRNWCPVCKLTPHIFPNTGRGLKCLTEIQANEILVKIPKELLITTSSLRDSGILKIVQNGANYEAQCLLATFLVYEKHLGNESRWKPYLDSLPVSYTNPDFCSSNEKKKLSFFLEDLETQSLKVQSNYLDVKRSLDVLKKTENHFCSHCDKTLYDVITFSLFKWAYYTVNTRAVYIDAKKNVNKYAIVKDADNMALAPFLDLFNHNYDASVDVSLVSDDEKLEFYCIKTLKPFIKESQVFINYGSHNNRKLFIEYGFFIPKNPLDEVSFDFSHVKKCRDISKFSYDFVVSQSFDKNMGFTTDGMNYNAKIVLFILSTELTADQWKIKVYNGNFSSRETSEINALGRKILQIRMSELIEQLDGMRHVKNVTESFKIATNLLEEYIRLLNTSLMRLTVNTID